MPSTINLGTPDINNTVDLVHDYATNYFIKA